MRQLALLLLLGGIPACVVGEATGPAAAAITVRLRNEIGGNAGVNQVILTFPESTRVDTRTGINGTVKIRVEGPGVYRIWVVPRAGFVGSETLTRNVTVAANEHVVVDFTLFRESDRPGTIRGSRR